MAGKTGDKQQTSITSNEGVHTAQQCMISQAISTFARQNPNACAISDLAGEITYLELSRQVAQLAQHLRAAGLNLHSAPIALSVQRNRQMIIAILAVLRVGAVLAPLDPAHPLAHRLNLLRSCGASMLLGDSASLVDMLEAGLPCIVLDQIAAAELAQSSLDAFDDMPCNALGFIVHTSGSTGQPKGVQLQRQAMFDTAQELATRLEVSATSRMQHFAALGFDAAMLEAVLVLLQGGQLHIVPESVRADPQQLAQFLLAHRITHAIVPAALLPYLPIEPSYALQALVVAGDVASENLLWAWAQKCQVFNGYGPAEITVCASMTRVQAGAVVSIGEFLPGVLGRVLNEAGEAATQGELLLGGARVAQGYCRAPELSAEKFFVEDGVAWYRTGDIVRYSETGDLLFAGRHDDQVKIAGNRVELGMLEAVLREAPEVLECVVLAQEFASEPVQNSAQNLAQNSAQSSKRLLAWVVLAETALSEPADPAAQATCLARLQTVVRERLPHYYLPHFFLRTSALPLTPNRKVDKLALRREAELAQQYSANAQPSVAGLFAAQLGLTEIAHDANFFALGGNSIAVLRLLDSLRTTFGYAPSIQEFHALATVQALEKWLALGAQHALNSFVIHAAQPAPQQGRLTPQQQAIWFLHHQHPNSKAYLAEAVNWFNGALDVQALETALNQIFARHSIYRSVFAESANEIMQTVLPSYQLQLRCVDKRGLPEAERAACLTEIFAVDLPAFADLAQLPLARFVLVQFADDCHALLHQEHHIVHDGWGGSEFSREMLELYQAQVVPGYRAKVLPQPAQYLDFARTQEQFLQSDAYLQQLLYWQQQLQGAPNGVEIFGKRGRSLQFEGAAQQLVFSRAQWQAIENTCRGLGVSMFSYTLAVLMLCLARYSGQNDIPVGSAFAARSWGNSAAILGMLVNTIVLRQKIQPTQSLRDFLLAVQTTVAQAQANEDVPFSRVVQALNPERSNTGNPFFNVLLGFHDTPIDASTPPGLAWRKDETVQSATSKFDIDCLVIPRKGNFSAQDEVHFLWEYRSDVYSSAEIALFLQSFQTLFLQGTSDLAQTIGQMDALSAAQRQMLQDWGTGPQRARPAEFSWPLALQAHPGSALALIEGKQSLSYAQLIAGAAEIAQRLQHAGVAAGMGVALQLPRSIHLVQAMLAVFQLQAVALVLAVDLPGQRRELLLQDAQPVAIVKLGDNAQAEGGENVQIARLDQASEPRQFPAGCAYILYTSGSSGTPKGVLVGHAALLNLCMTHIENFSLNPTSVGASLAPPSFDAWLAEIWPLLLAGARVVLLSDAERDNTAQLAASLQQHAVSHICFSTGLFEMLMEIGFAWPNSLRTVLTGGDRLGAVRLPRSFSAQLYNMYGPTETTVDALMYQVPLSIEAELLFAAAPPLGRPIANAVVRIMNIENNQDRQENLLAAPGALGELWIGGAGIAFGYLERPELTAERFVELAGTRFYRSGDLARWNASGQIEFLGRQDDEVKIRGFRVNLGEIEACLQRFTGVAQAAARAHQGSVFAYVTGEAELSISALQEHIRRQLPDYMCPSIVLQLAALPLTAQGKVARAELPLPEAKADNSAQPPQTALEIEIAQLWAHALQREVASIQNVALSFFALGGHSLLAMKLCAVFSQRYGVEFAMQDFFHYPSIGEQARMIATLQAMQQAKQLVGEISEEGEI